MPLLTEQIQARLKEFHTKQYHYSYLQPIQKVKLLENAAKSPEDFPQKKWKSFSLGQSWPKFDTYYWLYIPIQVPESFQNKIIDLQISLSNEYSLHTPEALVFIDNRLKHGIDRQHNTIRLSHGKTQPQYEVLIRVYSGQALRYIGENHVSPYQFTECTLGTLQPEAWHFYSKVKTVFEVAQTFDENSRLHHDFLNLLAECFNRIDYLHPRSTEFYNSIANAHEHLTNSLQTIQVPPTLPQATCIGHAHIDLAWLWPIERTREKAIHTFSTVLDLMDRYPDFHFFQSQPQLYAYLKNDAPDLFRQIKKRIKEGRWEADGAMWVESDCNLPSGESLVRQFLYGTRFFEKELGVKPKVLWLPDVFGFCAALPQIMRQAEIEAFMTTKLSWNQFNEIPHDTFRWRGMDGSEVLAHFITTPSEFWFKTYNGILDPPTLQGAWDTYKQKEAQSEILFAFGYGDGGGGPTEAMLQTACDLQSMPGFLQVQQGRVSDFFERLVTHKDQFPEWHGELYLEYHRGTYTSQAKIKRWNRAAERLMQCTEFLASLAAMQGKKYPTHKIRELWERILLNQFHDILPGSSVAKVYEDCEQDYTWINEQTDSITQSSLKHITEPNPEAHTFTLINPLGWPRLEPILALPPAKALPLFMAMDKQTQPILALDGNYYLLFENHSLPAYGWCSVVVSPEHEINTDKHLSITTQRIENDELILEINDRGELTSIFDKQAQREVLAEGERGNVLQAFEDKPLAHDAWDIDLFYQEKLLPTGDTTEVEIMEEGPLRATLLIKKNILDSEVLQWISLYRDSRRIEFDTQINWLNKDVLLKTAFPVAINADMATYDIQFGHVQRPTHHNTSWDLARFETCAHKWVDLSEGDYGVSLLNDSKYGHDVHGNTMRLTLIKSASAPDPSADVGIHHFRYALYPHAGTWREAKIPHRAYELNHPPLLAEGSINLESDSFLSLDRDHVILETIKWAENDNALILRLYEAYNQRGPVTLTLMRTPQKITQCNLLERDDQELSFKENQLIFTIKPFEIKTFKVYF